MKRGYVEVAKAPDRIRKHVDMTTVTCGTDVLLLYKWNDQFYAPWSEIFNTFTTILPGLNVSTQRVRTFKKRYQNDSFETTYDCNELRWDASGELKTIARFIKDNGE
jgi:hypothetical protein